MAHHKDAWKRLRQSEKRRLRNRHYKSRIKTFTKKALALVDEGDYEKRLKAFRIAEKEIMHAKSKGIIHRNTAYRKVSRLAKKLGINS